MPNDPGQTERSQELAIRGALAVSRTSAGTFTVAPQNMGELIEFAKLMSVSGFCVRPAFRNNPGACLAVALQAFRCGGDPFAWANKAYVTRNKAGEEQISYEAQLVHATVNTSPVLRQRLRPHYEGAGQTRKCTIVGYIRGEEEPFEYESPEIGKIAVKNSPLWAADPDQQLFYYSTRAWARRHVPEILLGIYAPEEFEGDTIDLTPIGPEPQRQDFVEHTPAAEPEDEPPYTVVDLDGVEHGFREAATAEAALIAVLEAAAKMGVDRLEGVWETNLREPNATRGMTTIGAQKRYNELITAFAEAAKPRRAAPERKTPDPASEAQPTASAPVAAPAQPAGDLTTDAYRNAGPFPESRFPATTEVADPKLQPLQQPLGGPQPQTPYPEQVERPPVRVLEPPIWHGKPDYRTYVIGLILPKVRQAKTTRDLTFFLGDNEAHLTAARAALAKDDGAALDEAIAQRFRELG